MLIVNIIAPRPPSNPSLCLRLLPLHLIVCDVNVPRDLTDNLADEGGALADAALLGRDAGLSDARGGLLLD